MKKVIRYVANDGTVFKSVKKCKEHERKKEWLVMVSKQYPSMPMDILELAYERFYTGENLFK